MGEMQRIGWFVLVGSLAAVLHWLVVVGLVRLLGAHPLAANVAGWLSAFGVSFGGHHRLTFRGHGAAAHAAAARFLAVSATAFALNEAAYAVLLRWTSWRYDVVLAAVLVGVAVMTYLLGRHWAFVGNPGPPKR